MSSIRILGNIIFSSYSRICWGFFPKSVEEQYKNIMGDHFFLIPESVGDFF
jgi:hypothetical protein